MTDAQGRYSREFTPTGGFGVNPDQFDLARMGLAVPPQVFVDPSSGRATLDFTSPGRGNLLRLRVLTPDGTPPASGFGITAENLRTGAGYVAGGAGPGWDGTTEGRLPPDRYRLTIYSAEQSGPRGTAEVDLGSGDVVGLVITAQLRGNPNAPRVALFRGAVRGPAGPVGGAFVSAPDGPVIRADAQGQYAYFVRVGQAIELLVVPPAGSGLASSRIEAPPVEADLSGLDVTLGPGRRVEGRVTIAGGAVPPAGFQVIATDTRTGKRFGLGGAEFEGLTTGRFEGRLPPGTYRVDGLQGTNREFAATQDVDLTAGDAPAVTLVLGQTNVVRISGTVRGPAGPLAGVFPGAGPSPQTFMVTDALGRFTLYQVRGASGHLSVGYPPDLDLPKVPYVKFFNLVSPLEVDFVAASAGFRVQGQLLAPDGTPFTGRFFVIAVSRRTGQGYDLDSGPGNAFSGRLPPDIYRVSAGTFDRGEVASSTVDLQASDVTGLRLTASAEALQPPAGPMVTVSGRVEGPDGPVSGVFINLGIQGSSSAQFTSTDRSGRFTLQVPAGTAGSLFVNVVGAGDVSQPARFDFCPLESDLTDVNFRLGRGRRLRARIVGSDGLLFTGYVGVNAYSRTTEQVFPVHQPSPGLLDGRLPPDLYRVAVTTSDPSVGAVALVDLQPGDVTGLELRLTSAGGPSVSAEATPPSGLRGIRVLVGQSRAGPGDSVTGTVIGWGEPFEPTPVAGDVYLEVRPPSGGRLYLTPEGVAPEPRPLVRSQRFPNPREAGLFRLPAIQATLPEGVPPGIYTVRAFVVRTGTDPGNPDELVMESVPLPIAIGPGAPPPLRMLAVGSYPTGIRPAPDGSNLLVIRGPGILTVLNPQTERRVASIPLGDLQALIDLGRRNPEAANRLQRQLFVDTRRNLAIVTSAGTTFNQDPAPALVKVIDLAGQRLIGDGEIPSSPSFRLPAAPPSYFGFNPPGRRAALDPLTGRLVVATPADPSRLRTRFLIVTLDPIGVRDSFELDGLFTSLVIDRRGRLIAGQGALPIFPNPPRPEVVIVDLASRQVLRRLPAPFNDLSPMELVPGPSGDRILIGGRLNGACGVDYTPLGGVALLDPETGGFTRPVRLPGLGGVHTLAVSPSGTRALAVGFFGGSRTRSALVDLEANRALAIVDNPVGAAEAGIGADETIFLTGDTSGSILAAQVTALPAAPRSAPLEVIATDARSGAPLPGATLVVEGTGLAQVAFVTGSAVFPAVPLGRRIVIASAQGFAPAREAVSVVEGQRGRVTLALSPSAETATVRGVAVEALAPGAVGPVIARVEAVGPVKSQASAGVRPVAGATIAIPGTTITVSTAADGSFLIDGAPIGTFLLAARAAGFREAQEIATLERAAQNFFVLTLLRTLGR
jgi:hypothetical protein